MQRESTLAKKEPVPPIHGYFSNGGAQPRKPVIKKTKKECSYCRKYGFHDADSCFLNPNFKGEVKDGKKE
jgi:hypothetical protein